MRVVGRGQKICSVLFDIAKVPVSSSFHLCGSRGVACDRDGHFNALVQGTQENRLPTATREPRHANPVAIHAGMVVEVIEPTPHFEQKNSERIGAHQIEMRAIPMFVSFLPQLAEGEPFQIKRQNPVLSEIDAALLLVFDRFSLRPHVTVDVQYRGRLPSKFFWLVKNRYGLKAGNDFIAQFMKAVTLMGL